MPNFEMEVHDVSMDVWRAFWVSVACDKVPYIAGLERVEGMGYQCPSLTGGEGGA